MEVLFDHSNYIQRPSTYIHPISKEYECYQCITMPDTVVKQ